ncbi:hypothetical protein L9W73_17330 [Vibrio aestuarianus]|uniref:Uncharacterized protein n=1 Tax=Vibrio aestuarianus TaxID=28171 RepID=A0A9X4FKD5_9VIBR|nr:hypothetical protein [Vibrio aestuarianus]MDE1333748.1 hypothetical protein [Vibrio aestuarianus]MDE1359039.1 hypothetical protein [Vibrio aestuarianus]
MNSNDVKTIYELMKNSTHIQIIWIGFLVAPFVVSAWFDLIDRIPTLSAYKLWAFLVILIAFFLMLVVAVAFDSREKKKQLLLAKVYAYMQAHNYQSVRFSTFRKQLNLLTHTDEQFVELINVFPDKLRLVEMKLKLENGEEDESGKTEPGFGLVA